MYAYVHQVYLKLLVLALLTNIGHLARGQYSLEGFSIGDSSIQWFDEQIGLQAHELFTGVYEPLEDRTGLYHPFWASRSWAIGEIFYRGEHFQGIYLLYDLEKDQVLTRNHEGKYLNEAIRLNQEQIDWFRLGGAHFENKEADTVFSAGFYEVLYRDGTGKRRHEAWVLIPTACSTVVRAVFRITVNARWAARVSRVSGDIRMLLAPVE